jgi:hypothetical protein
LDPKVYRVLTEPQVITAFFATAGLSVIASASCLMLSRRSISNADINKAEVRDRSITTYSSINPIDKFFRRLVSDKVQTRVPDASFWADCLYDLVVSLSDQQLVAGLAILISGVIGLGAGTITVYHFSMVTSLAWFSSNTHLLSLVVVRSYLDSVNPCSPERDNPTLRRLNHQVINWIRIGLMILMAALLLYCSWVSGYESWDNEYRCPAKCTLDGDRGGDPLKWMRADFFYVFYNYIPSVLALIRPLRIFWIDNRHKFLDSRVEIQPNDSIWEKTPTLRCLGYIVRIVAYIMHSETLNYLQVVAWFCLGAKWLFDTRKYGHNLMKNPEDENKMGFGQLVPLILLLVPLLQLADSYARRSLEEESDKMNNNTDQRTTPQPKSGLV